MAICPYFQNKTFIGWLQPSFPGLLFSFPLCLTPATLHCHWPQTEWNSSFQGFLLSIISPRLLTFPYLHHPFCPWPIAIFPLWSHPNSHPYTPWSSASHMVSVHPCTGQSHVSTCIFLLLYWYTSYYPFYMSLFKISRVSILFTLHVY